MSRLVAIEGIDGAGKSSLKTSVAGLVSAKGVPVVQAGELQSPIRGMLKRALRNHLSPLEKTLLFAADRALTLVTISQALESDTLVLWDRYIESALVYREIEFEDIPGGPIDIDYVLRVNAPFPPADWTILLDLPAETALERAKARREPEVYDLHFLRRARDLYLEKAETQGFMVIDARKDHEAIAREVTDFIMHAPEDM